MKKYEKVFREDYERWYQENQPYRDRVALDPARLRFHLMPETGWLNDPNGLCQFHGTYHIYYQYTPFEPTGELKLWGHCTTRNFVDYHQEEPVLFPDTDADAHGVYSGSAFVKDDEIHYFYTGNVKYFDRPDYDYIMAGRGSRQIHVTSRDGQLMSEKEVLLTNGDYPADISCHVRDPKIYVHNGRYYMALGARDENSRGLVLLYVSEDLKHWNFDRRITTREPFGYMWECPDLFEADGQLLLICCPQGVEADGLDYQNVHQCTVMPLTWEEDTDEVCIHEEQIRMVDRGFDFYAPQSFQDESGRRILIGWMGIPDADYTNPTVEAGWQHALTIPRELHVRNGRLYQTPLEELKQLREREIRVHVGAGDGALAEPVESGESMASAKLSAAEPVMLAESLLVYEAELHLESCRFLTLTLRKGVTLCFQDGILTLDLGAHGSGRGSRSVALDALSELRIYSDTTSLEIFVNGGEEVFTTRVYGTEPELSLAGEAVGDAAVYELRGIVME